MSYDAGRIERNVCRWWVSFGVALFLLVPLDLLTTLLAVARYGVGIEINPVVRWLFTHGLVAVAAANLTVVGITVYLFHVALEGVRTAPPSSHRLLSRVVHVWVGTLLVTGTVVVANNLRVLV